MLKYNNKLVPLARELRKNMTDAERKLWSELNNRQMDGRQFYRKRIIGNYIVDFYCPRSKLVIEIDRGQQYSGKIKTDYTDRDEKLSENGIKVLRFSNIEVLSEIGEVLEIIRINLKREQS